MNLFTDNYIRESTVEGYTDALPQLVPYMTFDEYCRITANPHDYTPIEYIFQYETANTDYNDETEEFEEMGVDILDELSLLYENNELKQLIEMGWDITIAPTPEAMTEARNIQLNWLLNNHVCNEVSVCNILNEITEREISRNDNLAPIFIIQQFEPSPAGIVITGYSKAIGKNWKYSHSGLALNSSLDRVYTFLLKGMSAESIVKFAARDNDIKVQALFITPKARNMIKKQLDYYLQNQDKTKYSFAGIGKLMFNMGQQKKFSTQLFCSEFVDLLLKNAHIDVSGKASENVAPEELGLYTDNINIYPVFEGKAKDYDQAKVDEKIEKLKKTVKYEQLNAVKTKAERTALKNERERTEAEKKEEFDNSAKGKVINAVKKAGKTVAGAPGKGIKALMNKYSEYQKSSEYDEPTAEELRKQLATESTEALQEFNKDVEAYYTARESLEKGSGKSGHNNNKEEYNELIKDLNNFRAKGSLESPTTNMKEKLNRDEESNKGIEYGNKFLSDRESKRRHLAINKPIIAEELRKQLATESTEEFLDEAATDPVKLDFNKFKKAWSFNNPAIIIKFEADCYDDEDMYNFGGYDVHDYPAFKKLKSDASRDELVQVVNNDFYAKFEKAIEKVNKVISGTVEIEGDWDTGNIVYHSKLVKESTDEFLDEK